MGRNTGLIKYVVKSPVKNSLPMYLYGSAIMSLYNLIISLSNSNTLETAIEETFEYYVLELTPFPLDVFLTWSGFLDIAINVTIAIVIGSVIASMKWRKSMR